MKKLVPVEKKYQTGHEFMKSKDSDFTKGSVNVKVEGPSVRLDKVASVSPTSVLLVIEILTLNVHLHL